MKDFLVKYFGLLGLVIYYPLAVIIRIPVFFALLILTTVLLLVWNPIRGSEYSPTWLNHLYDWYCGD